MKPKVGKTYWAVSTGTDWPEGFEWQFYIIAEVEHGGETYFVGLMKKPLNVAAHLFTSEGLSVDPSDYALGFRLVEASRAKPKWRVTRTP